MVSALTFCKGSAKAQNGVCQGVCPHNHTLTNLGVLRGEVQAQVSSQLVLGHEGGRGEPGNPGTVL